MRSGRLPASSRSSQRSSSYRQLLMVNVPVEVLAPLALGYVVGIAIDVDARSRRHLECSDRVQSVDVDLPGPDVRAPVVVVRNRLCPTEPHARHSDVIGHFRDADKDIPIWAIFEVMTLGNFGAFYDCLDRRVKTSVVRDLGMPFNLDSELRLKEIIYTLKDFRNAIAHNGAVLDVRFQTGAINTGVTHVIHVVSPL